LAADERKFLKKKKTNAVVGFNEYVEKRVKAVEVHTSNVWKGYLTKLLVFVLCITFFFCSWH